MNNSFNWNLNAESFQGKVQLKFSTNAPFRAQQGKIVIYEGGSFPDKAGDHIKYSHWDNRESPWKSPADAGNGWCCAWIAQASPNGPYVYVAKLITTKAMGFTSAAKTEALTD